MAYLGHQPVTGANDSFKILDAISSYTLTFDGSSSSVVSAANDTITWNDHRFVHGQRVTYTNGGGGNIDGLTTGSVYYIIKEDANNIKLATTANNAASNTATPISDVGTGISHTLNVAFDGINTKFKPTYDSGTKGQISRAAQLVISLNGVIQQPVDSTSPSNGFGLDGGDIVFSAAPTSTDTFWGHILTKNLASFEVSDNKVDNFTGDGSATEFTLSKSPANSDNVIVTVDGVVQYPSTSGNTRAYNVTDNSLVFSVAPADGAAIQARHIGFAGAVAGTGGVTGFYGRTGNVALVNTDNIVANDATFSGNVSIAKTLTYEDVSNIDSVGLVTAREGIFVPDNKEIKIGNTAAAPDLKLYHNETNSYLTNITGNLVVDNSSGVDMYINSGNDIFIRPQGSNSGIEVIGEGAVKLYNNGNLKFETTDTGVKLSDAILEIADTSCLIDLMETSATNHRIRNGNGNFHIQKISDDKETTTNQLVIDGGTGVTELYHNGNLRLQTWSDAVNILADNNADAILHLYADRGDNNDDKWRLRTAAAGSFNIETYATGSWVTNLNIASGGSVGIGTDNPDETLELWKNSGTNLLKVSSQANSTIGIEIEKTGSTTQSWRIADGQSVNGMLQIYDVTDDKYPLNIDTGQRVLLGSTSNRFYAAKLQVQGASDSNYIMMHNTTAGDANGNRYSKLIWSGTQSGGETSDLVHLVGEHFESADDQKGQLKFRLNTGSNNHSPAEFLRLMPDGVMTLNPVNSTSSATLIIDKDGDGTGSLRFATASANTASLSLGSDEQLVIKYGATETVRFASAGKMVSTISSPDPYNTVNTNLELVNGAGNTGAGSRIDFTCGNGKAHIQSQVTGGNSNSGLSLVFATSPDANGSDERLRIDSNGNVRIGPAGAPNLAVGGGLEIERVGAATIRIEDSDEGSGFEIQNTGGVIKQRLYNNQPWTIEYGDGEKLRITSAGRVQVKNGTLDLGTADTSSGHINSAEVLTFNIDTDNDDTNRYFAFYKNGSDGSGTELLRIKEDGKVGIGTDQTLSTLQIYGANDGEGTATGQLTLKDTAAYNASPTAGVVFQGHHASNNAQAIFAGIRGFKANANDSDYDGCLGFDVRKHGAVAYEAMRINEDGEVRIGGNEGGYKTTIIDESNRTTTAETQLLLYAKHDGSGNTGVGFGGGIKFWGDRNGDNAEQTMGNIMCVADVNSGTTLSGALTFETSSAGVPTEKLRIGSDSNITQTIDSDGDGFIITTETADIKPMLIGNSNRSTVNNTIFGISGKWNNTEVGRIAFEAGADTTNKDDGKINLYTRVSGGSLTSRLLITSTGNVGINDDNPGSQLVVRATTDDNPAVTLYRHSTGGDIASLTWETNSGTQAKINYRGAAGASEGMQFYTAGGSSSEQRMVIDHSGNVGIGTNDPQSNSNLHIHDSTVTQLRLETTDNTSYGIIKLVEGDHDGTNDKYIIGYNDSHSAQADQFSIKNQVGDITFMAGGVATSDERLRIRSDGKILIGTSTDRAIAAQGFNSGSGWSGWLQLEKPNPNTNNNSVPIFGITAWNGANEKYTGGISFNRSNSNTQGTQGAVNTSQQLGNIAFNGSDGTNFIQGAEIFAIPDQTFATNDGPASLVFATTPDGTGNQTPVERLRIKSDGKVAIGGNAKALLTVRAADSIDSGANEGTVDNAIAMFYGGSRDTIVADKEIIDTTILHIKGQILDTDDTNNSTTGTWATGKIVFSGRRATGAQSIIESATNWNRSAQTAGSDLRFYTAPISSNGGTAAALAMTLHNDQHVSLANYMNISASEKTGTRITSISHGGTGAFDGGLVFQTRCYEEYHFKWTGQTNHRVDLTGPSYMVAWVEYQFVQTNGGNDTMNHVRGKWANNDTTHTWSQDYASGGASALASGLPSFTATDQSGNASGSGSSANGRLRILEDYQGGNLSMSQTCLVVKVYYGNGLTITHTGQDADF